MVTNVKGRIVGGDPYTTIQGQIKQRKDMAEKLKNKDPDAVAWAKRVGLSHWHEIGWGCDENCLKGIGEQIDYDRMRSKRGKFKFPERQFPTEEAKQKSIKTRQSEARLKKEGLL